MPYLVINTAVQTIIGACHLGDMESRQPRSRYRSSTSASTPPAQDAPASNLALVLHRLSKYSDFDLSTLQKIEHDVTQLTAYIDEAVTPNASQDNFRRSYGFQSLLRLLQSIVNAGYSSIVPRSSILSQICIKVLKVLSQALKDHHGNRRYFMRRARGWITLQDTIRQLVLRLYSDLSKDDCVYQILDLVRALTAFAVGNVTQRQTSQPSESSADEGLAEPQPVNGSVHATSAFTVEKRVAETQVDTPEASTREGSFVKEARAYVKEDLDENQRICNEEAVDVLASLYSDLSQQQLTLPNGVPIATIILTFVECLIGYSSHNLNAIHSAGVLSTLLPCLDRTGIAAGEITLLRTLCESLLALGACQLSDAAELFCQAAKSVPAREMLLSALRHSKQPSNIQFDLSTDGHCSVELPALPRAFPPSFGYSLTAWIRIDKFDPESHTTLFGAFDTTQTCFVLVYIEKDTRQLILQTSVTSLKPSVRFKKARFRAGEWHHVAIVHRPPKGSHTSQAALYVNGRFVEEIHSQYPESPSPLHELREGNGPSQTTSSRRRPVQAFFGTPHDLASHPPGRESQSRWSLASAHLYDACLSLDMIAVQGAIGARYCGNFQDCIGAFLTYRASAELNRYNETVYKEKGDNSELVRLTQQHGNQILPESKLLISLSASAVGDINGTVGNDMNIMSVLSDKNAHHYQSLTRNGNLVLFNAARPAISEAVSRPYGVAIVTGNPIIHVAHSLDDAAWQVGGCLPIAMKILHSANTDNTIVTAVEILFECFQDNWRTSEAMEKGDGFGVLAILLREKLGLTATTSQFGLARASTPLRSSLQRDELAMRLLKIILKFVGYDFERPERSLLINPMAYRVLLLDFDTWRTVSLDCQKLYFRQIADFVWKNNNQAFNMKRFNRNRKQDL